MLVHWVQLYFFMYIHSDRQIATGIRKGAHDLCKHRSRDDEPSVARDKKQSSAKPGEPASGAHEAATAYSDAANCYKKVDSAHAILIYKEACALQIDLGRFTTAAKLQKKIIPLLMEEGVDRKFMGMAQDWLHSTPLLTQKYEGAAMNTNDYKNDLTAVGINIKANTGHTGAAGGLAALLVVSEPRIARSRLRFKDADRTCHEIAHAHASTLGAAYA